MYGTLSHYHNILVKVRVKRKRKKKRKSSRGEEEVEDKRQDWIKVLYMVRFHIIIIL